MSQSAHVQELLGAALSQITTQSQTFDLQDNIEISESTYKQRWREVLPAQAASSTWDSLSLIRASLLGGAIAQNLSQVFCAGYQSAMRHVLPTADTQSWYALCVSEDKQNPDLNPPVVASDHGDHLLINGVKSWVASSRSLDTLVVSVAVGQPLADDTFSSISNVTNVQWFSCAANAAGLNLTHREAPSFLADLSQGFARFENAKVPSTQKLSGASFANFMFVEALYVPLAVVGHLLVQWQRQEDLTLSTAKKGPSGEFLVAAYGVLDAGVSLAEDAGSVAALMTMQRHLQCAVTLYEAGPMRQVAGSGYATRWPVDGRLCTMYAAAVQKKLQLQIHRALAVNPD